MRTSYEEKKLKVLCQALKLLDLRSDKEKKQNFLLRKKDLS